MVECSGCAALRSDLAVIRSDMEVMRGFVEQVDMRAHRTIVWQLMRVNLTGSAGAG